LLLSCNQSPTYPFFFKYNFNEKLYHLLIVAPLVLPRHWNILSGQISPTKYHHISRRRMDDPQFRDQLLREISKADQIRDDYVNNNKIGVTSIRRLLENLYVRWRRGKADEKVEDYLIKNLKSSTKRQSYIEKIKAFRLQGEATHEVPLNVSLEPNTKTHDVVEPSGETDHVASTSSSARTQVTQPEPGTSRPNKRKRKGDELLLLEAKRFLGAR
jgi:hypothetical protein